MILSFAPLKGKVFIAIIIICLLFGFIIGYTSGFGRALSWSVNTGLSFLRANGIDIEVDETMVLRAFHSYQDQLNYCKENAQIYNNTRN